MLKLTPIQSLYFKEIMTGKRYKQISEELNVSTQTICATFTRICRRLNLTKTQCIIKYYTKELDIEFTDVPKSLVKYRYNDIDRKEQIRNLRKLGFTEEEIKEEIKGY